MPDLNPEKQRAFAVEVVEHLRAAGFEALWAGGCVRDLLLQRRPKDYDVATNARPEQVREVFGRRRTLSIGAAFGVITVLGPHGAGQIEVATFRRDAAYSDGRHPDSVSFSDAREDALRRDFTINGQFYDPIREEVIDYVGGREDLQRRVIRAIGDPLERFTEDKLRLLRAVRFAATFDFALDPGTLEAIGRMAAEIRVVSPERITAEMQRIVTGPHRGRGVRLVLLTGLAATILPEIIPEDDAAQERLDHALAVLDRLAEPNFARSLAVVFHPQIGPGRAVEICKRWRMSNKDTERTAWLLAHYGVLHDAQSQPWSVVQRILIGEGVEDLLAIAEAEQIDVAWCGEQLARPRDELDPPPLVTGDDLIRHGLRPGPAYRTLLEQLRSAQLDGLIRTPAEALAAADAMLQQIIEAKNRPSSEE